MCLSQRLETGPDLAGYAEWKSTTRLEVCPSLEVRIQEVSLSVPSYPVQQTRYNSLQAQCWLSILDFGDFECQFIINNDWQGWGLNMIGNQIWSCWFQH